MIVVQGIAALSGAYRRLRASNFPTAVGRLTGSPPPHRRRILAPGRKTPDADHSDASPRANVNTGRIAMSFPYRTC